MPSSSELFHSFRSRRQTLSWVLIALSAGLIGPPAWADPAAEKAGLDALRQGAVVLYRHANAPGVGDPAGFKLRDCKTQRNLDAAGRLQAKRMGERLLREQVSVSAVWSSQWCRSLETARLMGVGNVTEQPSFNSFFGDRQNEPAQTAEALIQLARHKAPGALVIVTHQVNITALTGVVPASGEGVVIRLKPGTSEAVVVGRLMP